MSEQQPTAFDALDSGSVAELASTGTQVWDSPAVGSHAAAGPDRSGGTVGISVPDQARTMVPGELFFV